MADKIEISCPICKGFNIRRIYSDRIPLHTHMLFPLREDPRLNEMVDIEIACCDDCLHGFHVMGKDTVLAQEFYATGEYKVPYFGQANSARIGWATNIVLDLCQSYGLKEILEVACGMGEVLLRLADAGMQCTGVDINPMVKKVEQRANLHIECLDISHYRPVKQFELILARLFMEHVDDPRMILERIKSFSGPNSFVVLEVPNVTTGLKAGRFFEYYHEHRQYYSVTSMRRLLASVGYTVRDIHFNPDQTVMIVIAQRVDAPFDIQPLPGETAKQINLNMLLADLVAHIKGTQRTLWWGAGFTGARIVNSLPPELWAKITLVDGDPNKQGWYLPGSKLQVAIPPQEISPSFGFIFVASISSAKEIIDVLRHRGYNGPVTYISEKGETLFVTDNGVV